MRTVNVRAAQNVAYRHHSNLRRRKRNGTVTDHPAEAITYLFYSIRGAHAVPLLTERPKLSRTVTSRAAEPVAYLY